METIHDFLAVHAHSKANNEAFTFIEDNGEKSQISFNELHQKAQSIAQYLASDFKAGTRVVLLFPPGLEYIQAFLGCLYAGVVAVPLYPPQSKKHAGRVLTVIDDCKAGLILTNNVLKQQLETSLAPLSVMSFDQLADTDAVSSRISSNADEVSPPTADQIAFLQYTSGSTGTPKGVMVSHGNIIANLKTLEGATLCAQEDVFCNWLPLFHDLGLVNTLLLPAYLGAHSVLMSPVRFIKSPLAWLSAISEYKASICGAPNFAFDHCIDRILPHQLAGIDLSSWRIAFNAAEPLDADTLVKFTDRFSRVGFKETALFSAYGMSEATVFVTGGSHATAYTAYPFDSLALQNGQAKLPEASDKQQILIAHGQVQAEHHLKIVSPKTMKELADGQVGEIWFAGPSVAKGYWNDVDKTKAAFGARLENDQNEYLRTGDLGFIFDGELYISGRIKDVMIIKGRNYYPQDFEKLAFNAYTGLNKNGAAAIEVDGKAILLLEVSRNMLKDFDYKFACETIKTAIFEDFEVLLEDIVFLKAGRLNKTSSGKIQRSLTKKRYLADDLDVLFSSIKGLSEGDIPQQTGQVVVPMSELEVELCALWKDVFGLENIGVEDNFLNLGGHSLLATTLVSQIQKKWNVEITIRDFFTANTVRQLAKKIESASTIQLPEIKPVSTNDALLPSFAQERMWLVNQIESELAQYNLSFSLKLYGELNESFLQEAFTSILTRHQTLRTTFNEVDGQVFQSVQESFQFDIPRIDLTDLTKAEQESRIAELSVEEATKHFNLAEDLMLRVTLLKLSNQSNIMLLTVHHIAADGWSLGVLTKELNAIYAALTFGSENPLAQLDIQYIDYAYWQRDWLKEEVIQNHLRYWKEHLSDIPVIHGLPLDHTRPAVQSFKGASVHHTLSPELQESLHKLANENDATFFMLVNAAFASFLGRYSGESDIVIGSPIANREQAELAPLMGLFINNLVFRSDLSADPAFIELLEQSKERTFAAYEHQQTPFEKLVDELQPERNLSHSPLFQIMLILQNQEMESVNLPGLDVKQLKSANTVAQYDLTLSLNESENGLEMEWLYATDLFTQSTIERMIGHFDVFLQGIIKSPQTKISQLPLISKEESTQILYNWNDTASDFPQDKCIHELFEEQVARNPNAVASVFNKEELTYAQLNQRANQLAHYLISQGVKPDSVVGTCVERSLDMLVAVLAIMKSGGAYLPLDPAYPKARLAYMIEDSGVQWVITQKHLAEQCSVERVICLDDESFNDELKQLSQSNPDRENLGITPNHLAYLIYTSGSTGKPKGVMLEHLNLTNFLTSMQVKPGMTKEDTLLAVTSLSFDIHALELYLPLIVGASVVIASSDNVLSPEELALLIEEHQVTNMQATPSTWKMLVNNDWKPQQKLKVLCGGEALSGDLKDELLSREAIELWNMYGPTETAVWSATRRIEDVVSLGPPIANTQFYVLDPHLNPVPVGVAGELYIGGEGVARGYLNQPELTASTFINNPFVDQSSVDNSDQLKNRIYKTGDLVRWLPDGTLEYLRRLDLQVKIRGHRIELGEIESGLQQHPEVQDAVVHVWDEGGFANLVAYVTGKFPAIESDLQKKLTDYLEDFLPAHMIPNAFVCLEQIPLTPNGKINRNALPKPQFNNESEYVAPETATEKQLCKIWEQLLNLDVDEGQWISVSSNFFHLGGHSLLAARLVSQIRKHWNVEVPIRTLFTEQTARKLAKVIDHASVSHIPQIMPVSTREPVPVSYDQQRLWLLDQIDQGSNQYNLCRGFQLSGTLDVEAIKFAFQSIVERHLVLRTTFQKMESGHATQVVTSDFNVAIEMVNLSGLTEEVQKQTVLQHMEAESSQPFDLSSDLMIRVKLLQFNEHSHALLVTMHHIAVDGWSEGIIINEFTTLYRSFVEKTPNSLPDLEIEYTDYSQWQNSWLQGEVLEQNFEFWKEQLAGIPEVHNLPLDHPRPAILSYEGLTHKQVLSADIQEGLNELARKYDVTLFMVLNAAFSVLLSRYSNEDDIVVGTPVANREQAELAPLVGFFVNTLVLRTNLSDNPSFDALLQRSKEYLLGAYEHQQLPFEKLVEELQPDRSLSYSPLIQVKLALQNNELGNLDLPGLSITEIEQSNSVAKLDLSLDIFEMNGDAEQGGFLFEWEYATALFNTSTIEQIGKHFEVLLKAIIETPESRVGDLPILTPSESQLLLSSTNKEPNNTVAGFPKDKCIHELFEEQAALNPDAVAVIFSRGRTASADEKLTYGELNAEANQVAHYLVEQGVKPDTLVGLCVERSLEMVIGQLAILKAGGAYVPIDPSYPEDRIEYILDDSGVEIVLTENELLSELPLDEQQVLPLDEEMREAILGDYSTENINKEEHPGGIPLRPTHLAYVIYTSGSTGQPKGVLIEHTGIVNLAHDMRTRFGHDADSCVLQYYSYAFDAGAEDWIAALTSGGKLQLISNDDLLDLNVLTDVVNNSKVTHLHVPPSVLALLDPDALPSVKTVEAGGEKYSQELVDKWAKDKQFFNVYGPTETSISSSFKRCHPNEQVMSIGQSIPNVQYYVLDRHFRLCPVGVAGELYIGGVGVGRGYINQLELTNDKFISNPFNDTAPSSIVGDRLYRTGDLVRWIPDTVSEKTDELSESEFSGELEFLGRIDHQVKIRGFRVELSEIESVLQQHEHVSDVAVIDRDEPKKLVAFFVPSEQPKNIPALSSAELIESLRVRLEQSLPDYMMPAAFIALEELPLTSNGKVDRKALLKIDVSVQLNTQKFVAPKTDIEKQLCEIWQSLLKIKQVGITDNFFALGGDSILAIQVVNRVIQAGMVMTTRQIFECQTIEKLALQVNIQSSDSQSVTPDTKEQTVNLMQSESSFDGFQEKLADWKQQYPDLEKVYHTTGMQQGMLFHSSLDASAYVSQLSITLAGKLNICALKQALTGIISRHDAYRTVFTEDFTHQLILSKSNLPLVELDWSVDSHSKQSEASNLQKLDRLLKQDKAQGFDVKQAPLMRITLVKLSSEKHCLVWSNHHALTDGWSLPLVFKDIMALYVEANRDAEDRSDPTQLLSILPKVQPYGRYINWLEQQDHGKARVWWQTMLANVDGLTDINVGTKVDYQSPEQLIQAARKQTITLPPEKHTQLKSLAKANQVTLNTLVQAAWAYLLHRYSGADNVIFGETISGRPAEISGVEQMVGLFINSLPVQVTIDPEQEISEWLQQLHHTSIDRVEHGFLPLTEIQNLSPLGKGADRERNLFDTLLVFENFPVHEIEKVIADSELNITDIKNDEQTNYGLTLTVLPEITEQTGQLGFELGYRVERFEEDTITRILKHLEMILSGLLDHNCKTVGDLSILSAEEENQLLVEWNNTYSDCPQDKCIHELFEDQAERNPDAIAAVFNNEELSYSTLNERSNQLAHYLVAQGIKPDSLVGVCVERSLDMLIAVLAILKSGGAYLPLDPSYPKTRIENMVKDSGVQKVITQKSFAEQFSSEKSSVEQIICLNDENFSDELKYLTSANLDKDSLGLTSNHLAYLIYTSGSTGTPKGVMLEHHNITNFLSAMQVAPGMRSEDALLAVTSLSFDIHVLELYLPLMVGGRVIIASAENVISPADLQLLIKNHQVTTMQATPATWKMLLNNHWEPQQAFKVLCGGEALSNDLKDELLKQENIELWNMYGPTETAVWSATQRIDDIVTLGTPIANTQFYVLDPQLKPVPVGVAGELYIGGEGVARGYFNQSTLTAERFISNPFVDEPTARLYKTGDLVRWLPGSKGSAGHVEYIGRIDQQVKIRGYRIELGEIESRLNQHAEIKDSVVIAQGQESHKQLIAFYLTNDIETNSAIQLLEEDLKIHLQQTLPEYMLPIAFVRLETVPLMPNGKVNRRSLESMDLSLESKQAYLAPRNDVEQQLVEIWAEVLKLESEKIGVNDSFFELGGHSLLATQVMTKIRSKFAIDLAIKVIFEHDTIAGLAGLVVKTEKSKLAKITSIDRKELAEIYKGSLPLSYVQERLWFIDQLEPNSAGYSIPGAVTIKSDVSRPMDINRVEQALNLIITRHENLRTLFPSLDGKVQQVILERFDFKLESIDLSDIKDDYTRNQKAQVLCQTEASIPFDISQGPLIRGKMIKLTEYEHVLMLNMHHIISDGWSMGIIIKEFRLIMEAFEQGMTPTLPPLPVQYLDYSIWQRTSMEESGLLQNQLEYWQEKLDGVEDYLNLSTDYPRPSTANFEGATETFSLDFELTNALNRLSETHGSTLYMTLQAAFKVLLYRYTGQEDICFGGSIANRQHEETEDLIGMFANTLVFRDKVEGEDSFVSLLAEVKRTCIEAYEHQDTPFEKIVELVQPDRTVGISPLFQVMLVLHNVALDLSEEDIQDYPLAINFSRFDLILHFTETPEGLDGMIVYKTALFKPQTIERMVKHFTALCKSIVAEPATKVCDLDYLGETEKQQLLIDYNNTQAEYPKDKCIHQLFTEQLAVNPEKTAVIQVGSSRSSGEAGSTLLSYQQLHDKSYELALFLQSLGVKPDSLVGLCVDRSLEMMMGILGILQAGGAYVPLDPDYPDDRLSYMLEDSQVNIVLTLGIYKDKLKALGNKNIKLIVLDDQDGLALDFKAHLMNKELKLRNEVKSDNLAYVIYTSGSTGQPKGVMIEHRMVVDYCYSVFKKMDLHHCDTFAAVSTFSSDLGNIALYVPIMFSKTIYLFSDHYVNHPVRLKNYLDNHPIDCMKITPSHFEMFKISDAEIVAPSKVLIFAGEPLTKKVVDTVNTLIPSCKVFNNYGPTETTISKLSTSELMSSELSSIYLGKPLNNTQIYILDANNKLQPVGVPGELHIAGDGVARGYLNRPDLTAEKFIPNPFNPGTRMYKSGDLARWLDDGNIEYLGRTDTQVKIRGFRIELSEIEAQLNQYPGIKKSVVVVQGQEASKQLIAFYATANMAEGRSEKNNITNEDLKEHLLQTLPEYMLPAAFVSLEAIPLMPNGKVDRLAIESMDVSLESSQSYLAPRNETEKKLVELWAEVLELEPEKIGINDNFFELGGHSLLAIMLVSKAVEHDIYFEIRDMFNHPNIQDLMENCEVEDDREIIREEGILEDAVALSPIQQYFFERIQTDINYFNQSVLLNLNTSVVIEDLSEMIMRLIEQHDALRFRYTKDDKGWQQHYQGSDVILSELFGLHSYDISGLEENKIPQYIEDTCNQWQAELDIENGPVMRWVYFDANSKGRDQLAIIIHHLMIDNISWRILLEDLNRLIGQQLTNQTFELSQKRSSYRDWVNSLANYKDSDQGKIDLAFWIEQSKKTQNVSNPFEPKVYRAKDIQATRVSLSETNTEKLLKNCNQVYGTDINDLLMTALVMSYHKTTGNSELMIEMEGHGRDDISPAIDITKTVGWFTSIYPVYFGLSNPEDIGQSIKEIKESLHEIPNKGVGFSIFNSINQLECVKQVNKPQVKFNYLGEVRSSAGESTSNYIAYSQNSSGNPLSLQTEIDRHVTINGLTESGQLSFTFNYPKEWQGQQISHWQTHFISALEVLIEHCYDSPRLGYTPSDFPLLTVSTAQLEKITLDLKEQQNITLDNIQDIYPLTPSQSGILFETLYAQTQENKGMYLQQYAFGISGQADIKALQQAWQLVVNHYEALRTFIITTDVANISTNLQVILKQVDFQINRIDCSEKTHAELKPVCDQWMKQSKRSGISFDRAPLARVSLLQGQESCYMVFEQHHIVTDGWSKNIVLSNVFKLYLALVQQQDYQLPPTAPYKAHVQALLNRDLEEDAFYWKKYLINYEEKTPLPMSELGPRRDIVKECFDNSTFSLSEENSIKLEQLAKKHGLTMNNVLQFMWGLLLHLHSGNKTIVFGSVSSGRSGILEEKHGDQMVGLCINTIPTCIQFDASLSLLDHLKQQHSRESEKLNYESTPLVFIQELLGIQTNKDFFQTLFVYESYPVDKESATTSMFIDTIDDTTPNYPLSLIIEPREKLYIGFEYDNYYYNKETIDTLIGQFERLIRQFIAAPESTIKEVSLISAQEKQQLLIDYNNTQVDYPHDKCIHQLIIEQVAINPDKIAAVYQDQTLSYQQLYDKSHDLALYLQSLGVKPDSLVGLCVERSLDMIVGMLGILQAGGAYVPLDPDYPDERLAYMLQDSQVEIVLSQEKLQGKLSKLVAQDNTQLIALDQQWSEISDCVIDLKAKQVKSQQEVKPHHLAYVIYTSGSTGKPKGVMVEHKALMNRIYWMQQQYSLDEKDIVLQKTPFSFDVSVWEFMWPMLSGASIVFAKPEGHKDAKYLEDLINKEKVTTLHFVPSMFNVYLNYAKSSCSSIKQIFCSGEALDSKTANDCKTKFPQASLYNLYGPTEAAIDVTAYDCSQLDSLIVPIGAPIANTQIYILDQDNNPVSIGVPGELHIAGDGLARGYLNRVELTEEKFIPNPFNPGTRMYKSGDLARWLDDGNIEYMGRIDTQVKIRGFRIEMGEIETRLNQYPDIKDTVVVAQGQEGNKQLIAFYVTNLTEEGKGIELANETLKGYLQQSLPKYMLPTVFVCLEAIPLTLNGKVDRRTLEQMDVQVDSNQTYLAPRNDMERLLTDIWADVLNLEPEKIGVNDSFFELGGHSLNAIQLFSKIGNQLAIDLPMAALFEFSTIAGLVEFIKATQYRFELSKDDNNVEQIEVEEGTI